MMHDTLKDVASAFKGSSILQLQFKVQTNPDSLYDILNVVFICQFLKFAVDIDECANDDENDCDTNALCTNTEGSYVCRCMKGYKGDGQNCAGIDTFCNC